MARGVPAQLASGAVHGGASNNLTSVGNLGGQLRSHGVPEPLIPRIIGGVHEAFTVAVAHMFWLAVVSSAMAFVVTLLVIRDVPLRGGPRAAAEPAEQPGPIETASVPAEAPIGAGIAS